jgi:hypothetical protein
MYPTNHFYGHNIVLGAYADCLPGPPPIVAHLQHGWNPWTGFGRRYLNAGDPRRLMPGLPKLVWTRHNVAECEARGLRADAVGAPFVYLTAMLQPSGQGQSRAQDGTIVYPYHSHVHRAPRDEKGYVDEVRDREGPGATVCLYWREHEESEIRQLYERAGFRVIFHGLRGDPLFLFRQHQELRAHARVVTNRASSALWYGGYLGLEMEIYGPVFASGTVEEGEQFAQLQAERWPDLLAGPVGGVEGHRQAAHELGASERRDPAVLRRLLGWTGPRRALGRPLRSLFAARRRLRGTPMEV